MYSSMLVDLCRAIWTFNLSNKHGYQPHLEGEAQVTMDDNIQTFLLPYFEVALVKLVLLNKLQF